VESSSSAEEGWPGVPADTMWSSPLLEEPLRTHGWPSMSGGIEVKVEVVENLEEHSACRCS
jgi:hypothetical protein